VDDSRIFFTDSATAGITKTTVVGSGTNLYVYEPETGEVSDLTPVSDAGVAGVVGASEDGAVVYFVAEGVLPGSGENGFGASAVVGSDNLYVEDVGSGEPARFIATLSPRDDQLEPAGAAITTRIGDWAGSVAQLTARVTPDGGALVFVSSARITGYDSGGVNEVYEYLAGGGGVLRCVSCNPSGEAPVGEAALIPDAVNGYQPRWVTDNGAEVFFDDSEGLVARDTNATWDVYEYEGGSDYLISGGGSGGPSRFDDATPEGSDVFFTSSEDLVGGVAAGQTKIYDARVGGGFPEPAVAQACAGEGCKGASTTEPVLPSAVTSGVTATGITPITPTVAAAPAVTFTVVGKKVVSGGVRVTLRVTGKGVVVLSGAGLKSVRLRVTKPGVYTVRLTAGSALAGKLRAGRRVSLKVKAVFTPSSGSKVSRSIAVSGRA
jgi:hypothetical protein